MLESPPNFLLWVNNMVQPRNTIAERAASETLLPALHVEKIDISPKFKKLVNDWYKIAKERYESFYSIEWRNKEKVDLAKTCTRVIDEIKIQLKKDMSTTSIYVVKDERDKIQGIALAKIQSQEASLECLVTHPANIALFEGEKPRRGVGVTLLTKVISETYKTNQSDLGLYAEPTAVSFYTKYGFAIREDVPKKRSMPYLAITRDIMKKTMEMTPS